MSIVMLLLGLALKAQIGSYEEWKKAEESRFDEFAKDREQEFFNFLKKYWDKTPTQITSEVNTEPKPINQPVLDQIEIPSPDELSQTDTFSLDTQKVHEYVESIETEIDQYIEENSECTEFELYGSNICIKRSEQLNIHLRKVNKNQIAEAYKQLAASNYDLTVKQIEETAGKMQLNDWGKVMLTYRFAQAMLRNQNDRLLLTWFLLRKTGLDARIGFYKGEIIMMMACDQLIYGVNYLRKNGRTYYVHHFDQRPKEYEAIYTYDTELDSELRPMDLRIVKRPKLKQDLQYRQLEFNYKNKQYTFNIPVNRNLIKLYNDVPFTTIDTKFGAPMDMLTLYAIESYMRPIIDSMPQAEAVNFILQFTQLALEYKVDQENFGYEKNCFAEETLFYAYSDCDDRVVLFTKLVKNLLGLETIALDYPGHISAAVEMDDDGPDGKYVRFEGKQYIMADPTYLGASLGMMMPEFEGKVPAVIKF